MAIAVMVGLGVEFGINGSVNSTYLLSLVVRGTAKVVATRGSCAGLSIAIVGWATGLCYVQKNVGSNELV